MVPFENLNIRQQGDLYYIILAKQNKKIIKNDIYTVYTL